MTKGDEKKAISELERLRKALIVLGDSTAWDYLEAWCPAMSPSERTAFDTIRENMRRSNDLG